MPVQMSLDQRDDLIESMFQYLNRSVDELEKAQTKYREKTSTDSPHIASYLSKFRKLKKSYIAHIKKQPWVLMKAKLAVLQCLQKSMPHIGSSVNLIVAEEIGKHDKKEKQRMIDE